MSRIGNTLRWVMILSVAPPLVATSLAQPPVRHARQRLVSALAPAPAAADTLPGRGGHKDVLPPEVLARVAALAPKPAPIPVPVRSARPLPLSVAASAVATPVSAASVVPATVAAAPASAAPVVPAAVAATLAAASAPAAASTDAPAAPPSPSPAPAASPAAGSPAPAAMPAGTSGLLGRPMPELARDATRVAPAAVAAALSGFVRTQLTSPRVEVARTAAEAPLREAFTKAGLAWPAAKVYFRAFKREHQLEVWGQREDGSYTLVKTFAICSLGGSALGPKVRRGDEQVPEGFYHVIEFNPSSEYHLSLRLDYPNAADLARAGASAGGLGGDIFLHGGCKSAGCLPLTDAGIEQIYWLAVQARASGERQIPIDIFPARMDPASWEQLTAAFAGRRSLVAFWTELKQGYDAFERTHRLPDVAIDASGRYHVALAAR